MDTAQKIVTTDSAHRTLEHRRPIGCTLRREFGRDRYREASAGWFEFRGCRGRAAAAVGIRGRPLCLLENRGEVSAGSSRRGWLLPRRLFRQLLLCRNNVEVHAYSSGHCSGKASLILGSWSAGTLSGVGWVKAQGAVPTIHQHWRCLMVGPLRFAALRRLDPLRAKTNFTSHFKAIWVVQIARQKYSASHFPQISSIYAHPASSKRGVRVVTIRGVRGAVDAMASRARGVAGRSEAWSSGCERLIRAGRAALLRTAKVCGSGTRGWCQIGGGFREAQPGSQDRQFVDDGGKRNSSPGRARHKPSNHCAGKAGCSPLDLYARVRTSLCHCTRDLGCSAHPVFPAPSHP